MTLSGWSVEITSCMAQSAFMSTAATLQAYTRLEHSQQLKLLTDLWESVVANHLPLPAAAQKKEILRRKQRHVKGKSKGRSWTEVKTSLLQADAR